MRLVVVAATNLLARGFQVVPTDRRFNGLYAVARAIARVLGNRPPSRAIAVIEARPPPESWPPLLTAQLPALPELLRTLGFQVVEAEGELDVVASYARSAVEEGGDAIVVGVDKRLAQLVSERVCWYDANKDAKYTPEVVEKRFGVPPAQVAEWLAVVGDDDAMPGITGIGAKGAATLLIEHRTVENATAAGEGRTGKILRASTEEVARELARARLDQKRPLPAAPIDYSPPPAAPLNSLFERLGFTELLISDGAAIEVRIGGANFANDSAIHALLEDPAPSREEITGIALSVGDGKAQYVPRASEDWPELVLWLEDPSAHKLCHDTVATEVALARSGITLRGITRDSRVAAHLAQPSNWAPNDLSIVSKQVLGQALPNEEGLRGVGAKRKRWADLPVAAVAEYAGLYANLAAQLWPAIPSDAEQVAEYLALGVLLSRMEIKGMLIDRPALDHAEKAFAEIEDSLGKEIEALAGHAFNVNSTKQLGEVLFAELKLPVASHTKTGWSTSAEALEKIEHAHPIVPRVIRWRLLRRLRDSWIIALRKCIDEDGRVHSRFHHARSFSGHLVNSNPDLGRVPGRTPEMAMIRRAFVAPPGYRLMSIDFQQLGLYVLAHLTKDPALVEPLRARADVHRLTAAAVLDKPFAEITTDERQLGKVVNFATFAGQGPSALALQLGVSAQEAKAIIARFDVRYAGVRAFQDEQLRLVRERGCIVTIAGRRWPIGGLESLDPHDRSYAERLARRATHEGSVSDVSRRALLEADRALTKAGLRATPLHQVVDEVLLEVHEDEIEATAKIASEAMRTGFALEVPLVVGVEVGNTWADLQPL